MDIWLKVIFHCFTFQSLKFTEENVKIKTPTFYSVYICKCAWIWLWSFSSLFVFNCVWNRRTGSDHSAQYPLYKECMLLKRYEILTDIIQWNQSISFWDTFKNSVFKAEDRISNLNVAENWKICFDMRSGTQKAIIPGNSRSWGLSS